MALRFYINYGPNFPDNEARYCWPHFVSEYREHLYFGEHQVAEAEQTDAPCDACDPPGPFVWNEGCPGSSAIPVCIPCWIVCNLAQLGDLDFAAEPVTYEHRDLPGQRCEGCGGRGH